MTEENTYSREDLIRDMKHDTSLLNEGSDTFGKFLENNIVTLEYTSHDRKKKRTIACSYKPIIEFYLSGLGMKMSEIRIELNKMNLRSKELAGDRKTVSTYCLLFKEPRRIPLENIKIPVPKDSHVLKICPDNIEAIIRLFKRLSRSWKESKNIIKRFS